jgi:hypothetical protein
MDGLLQQGQTSKALAQSSERLLDSRPEQVLVSYFDHLRMFGEYPTMQWLVARYGNP